MKTTVMKSTLYILLLFVAAMFLQSCEKARHRIVTGRIIDKETKDPISEARFKLLVIDEKDGLADKGSYAEYNFTTNTLGDFEIVFESTTAEDLVITYPYNMRYEKDIWELSGYDKTELQIDAGVLEAEKQ